MANLRGNSLVGGKPIVTIDMLNKFVEDIQAAQKDEMMHKYEREVITSNQVVDAYIKDKSKNGVWLCSNVQDFPMYNYGTLLNFSTGSSRLQLYAPHKKASSDKYHDNAGLFFRTGWDNDIKDWQQAASVNYVNDKDNEIKEEINNSLKTEQYLSHEGLSIYAENTIEGRTEDVKIYGKTLNNLCTLANKEYTTSSHIYHSLGTSFKPSTRYMLICDAKDSQNINITNKTTYLRVDDYLGNVIGGYAGNITTDFTKIFFEFTTPSTIEGNILLRQRMAIGIEQTIKNIVILEYDEKYSNINYFEGIKSFGEFENENKITISSVGKNLFDKSQYSEYENKNGDLEFTSTGNTRVNNFFYIFTEKKYRSKAIFTGADSSEREFTTTNQTKYYIFVGLNGDKKDNKVWGEITLPPNTKCYYSAINEKEDNLVRFKNIQIEVGSSKTDYEKNKNYRNNIFIKEPLRDNDIMCEENGKIKIVRDMKQYTFTGEEAMELSGSQPQSGNYLRIWIRSNVIENLKEYSGTKIICNNFPSDFINNPVEKEGIYASNGIDIQILKSKLSNPTIEGFKAWLKANPTTIVYQLNSREIETVESCIDLNLATFKERTYINIENNIKGDVQLKIPTNIYSMINNHGNNINNLYNKIEQSFYVKTILINEWQKTNDAFKYSIKHNLGTKLIANVAATKADGMSTNIDYKIVDENTIEIYVIDKAQLDIIIKTI